MVRDSHRRRCIGIALIAWALFAFVGIEVSRGGEPAALAAFQRSLDNHSTLVAWWVTWLCYVDVLAPVAIVLLIIAWIAPAWRGRIIFSIVMLLLCWRGADYFQHVFARPRPFDWVVKHEMTPSFPSSHAAIATGFYGLWAIMLYWSSPSRLRRAAGIVLAVAVIAICWSRLALGAHYVTDLIGGILLGTGFVAAGLAIYPVPPFRVAGRRYEGENRAV